MDGTTLIFYSYQKHNFKFYNHHFYLFLYNKSKTELMIGNKKASILLVVRVLEKYSDEDHFLTQQDIINKIYELYGVELERKSIAYSLNLLEELGYDLVRKEKGGVALFSRLFDETEASYLIDSIFSSRSIDAKEAKNLIKKISSTFSINKENELFNFNSSYLYKTTDIPRTKNKEIMYIISLLLEAIKTKKRVAFKVLDYDKNEKEVYRLNGFIYKVSPYYLINNSGRYYLLCNYRADYKTLNTFRIDYLKDISIIENDKYYTKLKDLDPKYKDFEITEYINNHIYFYGGRVIEVKIKLKNEHAVLFVKDWFNENAYIKNENDEIYAYIKGNENAILFWCLQYLQVVKVISPSFLKEKVKNILLDYLKD